MSLKDSIETTDTDDPALLKEERDVYAMALQALVFEDVDEDTIKKAIQWAKKLIE